ncbi:MAG: AIR synthase-related protein, partial [Pseudomonadota bacterium]|nr:AIR synthase-related protein [Pseudomonadota bacterium]
DWLQRAGNMMMTEMLRTFNCGIGMTVVVAPEDVDKVISCLTEQCETCFAIGHITERNIDAVTFSALKTD